MSVLLLIATATASAPARAQGLAPAPTLPPAVSAPAAAPAAPPPVQVVVVVPPALEGAPPPASPAPVPALASVAVEPPDLREQAPYFPVNFSLFYPISTNVGIPELRTNLALAVLLGHVGYVDGLQIGPVSSSIHDLHGFQLGAASLAGGSTDGIQIGGVFAFTDGPIHGAQIAGLLSGSGSSLSGLQFAGAANQARNRVHGVQATAGVNLTYGDVEGVQIGSLNIGKVRGLQLGIINISADTEGTQIGIINIARRSSGMQIGVINVTDDLRGESLGIASVPRVGGIHVVAWGSNSLSGNLGLKFSSKVTYSILSAAIHRDANKDTVFGPGLTLGIRFPILANLIEGFTLGSDFGGYRLFRTPSPNLRHDELYKTRIILEYEIARHFSIFVGGGAHVAVKDTVSLSSSLGPEFCAGLDL